MEPNTTEPPPAPAIYQGTNPLHLSLFLVFTVPLWLINVVGNLLVLVCVYRDKKLHRPSYYLVAALSVADISYPLLAFAPLTVAAFVQNPFTCNVVAQFVFLYPGHVTAMSSLLHIITVTLERYCSVICPVLHRNSLTARKVALAVGAIWLCSFLSGFLNLPVAFGATLSLCLLIPSYAVIVLYLVSGWMCFFLLVALNVHLLLRVRRLSNTTKNMKRDCVQNASQEQKAEAKAASTSMKATRGVIVIVFFFVLCWLTVLLRWALLAATYPIHSSQQEYAMLIIAILAATLNGAVNPVVYATQIPPFRSALRKLLRKPANRIFADDSTIQ